MNIIQSKVFPGSALTEGFLTPQKATKKNVEREQESQSRWQTTLAEDAFCCAMSYLEPHDIVRCEKACRAWNKMISESALVWKTQCEIQKVTLLSPPAQQVFGAYASSVKVIRPKE